MNNKQLYLINRAVLFLSIAYAVNNYVLPAIVCSIVSIFLTLEFNEYQNMKKGFVQVAIMFIFASLMIVRLEMVLIFPCILLSVLASILFAVFWVENQTVVVSSMIKAVLILMFVFLLIALIIPSSTQELAMNIVWIAIVFMPMVISYSYVKARSVMTVFDKNTVLR